MDGFASLACLIPCHGHSFHCIHTQKHALAYAAVCHLPDDAKYLQYPSHATSNLQNLVNCYNVSLFAKWMTCIIGQP